MPRKRDDLPPVAVGSALTPSPAALVDEAKRVVPMLDDK
jgi:hypothetical protein